MITWLICSKLNLKIIQRQVNALNVVFGFLILKGTPVAKSMERESVGFRNRPYVHRFQLQLIEVNATRGVRDYAEDYGRGTQSNISSTGA